MIASKIRVSLVRRNASKREKLVMGFVIMSAMVFLWIGRTSGMPQPNLTTVEALSETQIEVTWQPFDHLDDNKPHVYELYIDDYLEYFGNDVIYIARRLTPDTMYHFKLRSCVRDSERQDCSMFSKTLSGTTNESPKRGFTKSFIQWTILYLVMTFLATTTAILGRKITRRLWRSFLYRYDFWSETNLQLPKFAASTDTVDEDVMHSLCLKTVEKADGTEEFAQSGDLDSKEQPCVKDLSKVETKKTRKSVKNVCEILESTEHASNADMSTVESNSKVTEIVKNRDCFEGKTANHTSCLQKSKKHGKDDLVEKGPEYVFDPDLPAAQTKCKVEHLKVEDEETRLKDNENQETAKLFCTNKADDSENLTIQRAHTSPKLKSTKNSKQKKQSHRRTLSFDNNVLNKDTNEISESVKVTNYNVIQNNPAVINGKYLTDLVVVVDNSNIFIGAQECSTFLYPNERKRNIRIKIQQLVKVFQRGRTVSRAFVQGSSPPTTEQVWEVYRHLGYCVDVEDRRGKDEQRVDEGLHLHIYKALFEMSPRTLVIASGDGNKGKSECSTSLPGCAKAAIERGWKVEIHSWQHSTSMEWIKLSKKYPKLLSICYLDRFLNHITFVDGKYGRKCQPFPANVFKYSNGNLN